jgi:hypothetical protein
MLIFIGLAFIIVGGTLVVKYYPLSVGGALLVLVLLFVSWILAGYDQ